MASRALTSKLRDARLRRGLSQEALGQKLGITGAAIGHYETGLSRPTAKRAAQLAKILGLHSSDIPTSAREGGVRQGGGAATEGGRKASMRAPSGALIADKREIAMVEALRAMRSADRRVVIDMVIAYGGTASGTARKRRR
jgi:transcriptional regulator with XRE-family HTH domain